MLGRSPGPSSTLDTRSQLNIRSSHGLTTCRVTKTSNMHQSKTNCGSNHVGPIIKELSGLSIRFMMIYYFDTKFNSFSMSLLMITTFQYSLLFFKLIVIDWHSIWNLLLHLAAVRCGKNLTRKNLDKSVHANHSQEIEASITAKPDNCECRGRKLLEQQYGRHITQARCETNISLERSCCCESNKR